MAQHKLVSVPVDPLVYPAIERAAALEMRPVAAYCRLVIFKDLQARGLLDDEYKPTQEVIDAAASDS